MKRRKSEAGMSLIELILVAAMAGVIFTSLTILMTKSITFFKRMTVRQTTMQESRTCMERIEQALRNGKASSLTISTPAGGPPNSRVDFVLDRPLASGTTSYAFYLSNGKVMSTEYSASGTRTQVLANNATGLHFTGDSFDTAMVTVSIRIDAPWDSTGDPNRVSTLILPNRAVRMIEAP